MFDLALNVNEIDWNDWKVTKVYLNESYIDPNVTKSIWNMTWSNQNWPEIGKICCESETLQE